MQSCQPADIALKMHLLQQRVKGHVIAALNNVFFRDVANVECDEQGRISDRTNIQSARHLLLNWRYDSTSYIHKFHHSS